MICFDGSRRIWNIQDIYPTYWWLPHWYLHVKDNLTAFCSRSWGGTIKRNLERGDVKEGILPHKKLFETFLRHKVAYIQNWCPDESEDVVFTCLFDKLQIIITYETVDSMIHCFRHNTLTTLNGAMAVLMNIYLKMVNMLLNFLHFLRVGNWEGYLKAICEFLLYCSVLIEIIMCEVCHDTIFICYR